jgi:bacillithiol biosynthesis deacetylase BshB1
MPVDVLTIAAHPDDVELTCAGTLVMLGRRGHRFGMVDLTSGEMGTRGSGETRAAEARHAGEILGAAFRETLDLTDGGLQTGRAAELAVIEIIRREKPRLVITSYPDDRHPDHARAGRLVTDAAFYAGLRKLESGLPAHRPQQVIYFSTFLLQEPTLLVDVTPAIEIRRAAIRAFSSQFHDPASKEPPTILSQESFLEKVEARSRHFGMLAGVEFAEGFMTKRPPRIDDLVAAFEGYEAGY